MLLRTHFQASMVHLLLLMFGLAIIPSLGSSDAANTCVESERRALLSVKQGLANNSDWLSSWSGQDCCSWKGVACDNMTGHVTELHLRYFYDVEYKQPSTLHPSLSHLKHLRYLDLSRNFFNYTSIPKFIGDFHHLVYLNLSRCGFSGEFPQQIGNLSKLQELDLSDAGGDWGFWLVGFRNIHWLSKLTALEYLDMSWLNLSMVSSNLFQSVTMLPNLSELYLQWSSLTSIPKILPHNNLTSLLKLDFSDNYQLQQAIPQWIFNISSLVYLDLSYCGLSGEIPASLGSLRNMQHLDLSWNDLKIHEGSLQNLSHLEYLVLWECKITTMPESITNLTLLKLLDLSGNYIERIPNSIGSMSRLETLSLASNQIKSIPESICNLSSLEALALNSNQIKSIPECIGHLRHLKYLNIPGNNITTLPKSISQLQSLERLDLSQNRIAGIIPRGIGNLCNLTRLSLYENSFSGEIIELIDSLSKCFQMNGYGLTDLELASNRLNGTVPESLGQLSRLYYLNLSNNSFGGVMHKGHFSKSLEYIDISYNHLEVSSDDHYFLPSAVYILMCNCSIGPKFPSWLRNHTMLDKVCISSSGISDEFPSWFWDETQFGTRYLDASNNDLKGHLPMHMRQGYDYFDVSSNKLDGFVPTFASSWITYINLSNNSLSGPIPPAFANLKKLRALIISDTRINGTISNIFCNMNLLRVLDLSNNELTGNLPYCWKKLPSLRVLDFSNNNFFGKIPSSIGSLVQLQSLQLQSNKLFGPIPSSLKSCSKLTILDLSDNKLWGTIPNWDKNSSLKVLSLRSNHFEGNIPPYLSSLPSLQVLDLSFNNFTGTISSSLVNFRAMTTVRNYVSQILGLHSFYNNAFKRSIIITGEGQKLKYDSILSLVTSIDLSHNNFSGEIPEELMELHGLRFMNLSGNQFWGEIPGNIGKMTQLLSLDLSANRLCGKIPYSMARLTSLSYLNLSYNNLSGEIPLGGQLQSFNPSIYNGNFHLCGLPLDKCVNESLSQYPNHGMQQIDDDKFEMLWVFISFAIGVVVGSWLFVGTVLMHRTRSIAYYKVIDDIYDMLYVVIAIRYARLKNLVIGQGEA